MKNSSYFPLPVEIGKRAEEFFGEDLSDVVFFVSELPARLNTLACSAFGSIQVSPELLKQSKDTILNVFGHELVHVLQYRLGIEVKLTCAEEYIGIYDSVLEEQAIEIGSYFSNGKKNYSGNILPKANRSVQVQTYIEIQNKKVVELADVSESTATILGMIKSGLEWFDWAAQRPNMYFSFSSEFEFLESVQTGLHESNLIYFPEHGLRVSPARLLTMPVKSIRLLDDSLQSSARNHPASIHISKMLRVQNLKVKSDLDVGIDFLKQLKIESSANFQGSSLAEMITLFDLVYNPITDTCFDIPVQKEAAEFSIDRSSSMGEFVDVYSYYLAFLDKLKKKRWTKKKKHILAEQLLDDLYDATIPWDTCPSIEPNLSVKQLESHLRLFINKGGRIGFPSLSRTAFQVVKNTDLGKPDTGVMVSKTVEEFTTKLQTLFQSAELIEIGLSQDGLLTEYRLENAEGHANIILNRELNLMVSTCELR